MIICVYLFSDDSKFGQKLLEKMGWQKGQGLGAKNQGISECLKVAYKFDSTGLFFILVC